MKAHYGAHELMEVHEVLTDAIDGINQFQLYRPYVKDPQLAQIADGQIRFMTQEYNMMVQTLQQQGKGEAVPYRTVGNVSPQYGLRNPGSNAPNMTFKEMDDRDVASGMLGCQKSTATMRLHAALECADPRLRHMIQQCAINSSEEAYEVWNYMNQKGYYQVPTMQDMTASTLQGMYMGANMS